MPRSSGTYPRPSRALRCGGAAVMSLPASATRPVISRCSPMAQRSRVDFPAPLRPTRVTTSPSPTRRDTSSRAVASPYRALTPLISSNVGPQVRLDDPWIGPDPVVGALHEHFTALQDRDGVGERADDVHVVLDHHHGASLADPVDERHGAVDVLQTHAC